MATVTVTVRVNHEKHEATFSDLPGSVMEGATFRVKHGETIEWELQDVNGKVLKDGNYQIKFVEFPKEDDKKGLLVNVKPDKKPTRHVLRGTVDGGLHEPGRYRYELVNQDTKTVLICKWRGHVVPMVGGEDSGRP